MTLGWLFLSVFTLGWRSAQDAGATLLFQAIALTLDVERRRVVQQPVEDRRRQHLVVKYLAPIHEALIAGHYQACSFVATDHQPKE